jgi:hypothetical protein
MTAKLIRVLSLLAVLGILGWHGESFAGQLHLTWTSNSTNEDGFNIERKSGTTGTFSQIASVGANVVTYTDSNLMAGGTYCYRVNAFNAAGVSDFTLEACATVPVEVQFYTLNILKAGTGTGTVTALGINCGSDCSETYSSDTIVALTATPASGSTFAGWSGTGCSTGTVTMSTNRTCTATFNLEPVSSFSLTVAKAGTGSGTVTSSPAGINCGTACSANFNSGTVVALTATPASGSTFAGWSGTGCSTGTVTLTASTICTATFTDDTVAQLNTTRIGIYRPATGEWFMDYDGNGLWDAAIDVHIASFGSSEELPVVGTWSGDGTSSIGTFNPATGTWKLDTSGNDLWDDCQVDTCINLFGQANDLPVTRKRQGAAQSIVGTFTQLEVLNLKGKQPRTSWFFDSNANFKMDDCTIDQCLSYGFAGDIPIVGDWSGTGNEEIGVFRPSTGEWVLDLNGNGSFDNCNRDACLSFGQSGDLPVVGDWDNSGKTKIGVFRPSTGEWFLDLNGNGTLDNCTIDACLGPFGQQGDLPVVGKW